MRNAYISGTGAFVPPRVVTNDDLVHTYGIDTTHEWIEQRTGIHERRFADEGVGTVEMAKPAAEEAIAQAGLQTSDIDMILYATLSNRHCFPGDGVYLQAALGLPSGDNPKFVPAMDIRNQCSGFVYGLGTATAMVKSGGCQHVLVVGAECHSAGLDLTTRGRAVATLFGDGAGAVVVSATDEDRGVRNWFLGSDGRFADELCQRVWDTRNRPWMPLDADGAGQVPASEMWAQMNGRVVFKNAVEKMILALMQSLWDRNLQVADIDLFLFHQANLRINQYVAQQLQIPDEKLLNNIQRYGNTTAATIPLLMAEATRTGRLKPGTKVACVAFGSGFTWGACVIDW